MPLSTTVVGAFPKPKYLAVPNWFSTSESDHSVGNVIRRHTKYIQDNQSAEETYRKAIKEVLDIQSNLNIDVVTDGELRRENYVYYFCRRIKGIDMQNLTEKSVRNGAWKDDFPTIVADVEPMDPEPWVCKEWQISQDMCDRPVKITLPGPMTFTDSLVDRHYNDNVCLGRKLSTILNREIKALAAAGCKYIQVDEPVMVRYPNEALAYGIDNLAACFEGVPEDVQKCIHICCGYPFYMDDVNYIKGDKDAYWLLADKLDQAGFNQILLEDAHNHNDLKLFERFKKTKIVLGVVKSASSHLETVSEIQQRIREVLTVVPADHLIVSPDCGLGFLPVELTKQKLKNMVEAANTLP